MAIQPAELVSRGLARWILRNLSGSRYFGRQGLPRCDIAILFRELAQSVVFPADQFAIAMVNFGIADDGELLALATDCGLSALRAVSCDLHVATAWRNDADAFPRVVALAAGYNASVHGLKFFGHATSADLAGHLLDWAAEQDIFTATGQQQELIRRLRNERGLISLRTLEGVSSYLSEWSAHAATASIDAPREALPALGLFPDPQLFETSDLTRELERNLQAGEYLTVLSPGEMRARRVRAEKYVDPRRRDEVLHALNKLEAFRRGERDSAPTLREAWTLVKLPKEEQAPIVEDGPASSDHNDPSPIVDVDSDVSDVAVDVVLSGSEEDVNALGASLEAAWQAFDDQPDDTLVIDVNAGGTSTRVETQVDLKVLDWSEAFLQLNGVWRDS